MDVDQELQSVSSEQELAHSRCRRNAVHFATIGEFLSSLNINDTTLSSLQGLKSLSLDDYLRSMRSPAEGTSSSEEEGDRRDNNNNQGPRKMRLREGSVSSSESLSDGTGYISPISDKLWM
ncbi:hypothetical protein KR009_002254 [Drosophila setifemur]|nr:hypothetical protein KR009_002254 [Drosophila setifemur]